MSELEPPDAHFLMGAMGWLELGLPVDADRELDRIAEASQQRADVLDVRWQVYAAQRAWGKAVTVAETLVARAPERDSGWIHRAYALRRAPSGGLQRARDALLPAVERFPHNPLIPYNLACYAAQSERLEEAWQWFEKAMKAAKDEQSIKTMALADEDLKPLWERIREV